MGPYAHSFGGPEAFRSPLGLSGPHCCLRRSSGRRYLCGLTRCLGSSYGYYRSAPSGRSSFFVAHVLHRGETAACVLLSGAVPLSEPHDQPYRGGGQIRSPFSSRRSSLTWFLIMPRPTRGLRFSSNRVSVGPSFVTVSSA